MKNVIATTFLIATTCSVLSQETSVGPDWGPGGKYESLNDSKIVILNYANTKTQFFQMVAQKQKTALQKLNSEILSKEDLPPGVSYSSILGEVSLKAVAGFFDNLREKELGKVPLIGAIVDFGIESYKQLEQNIERTRQINSKNSLVDAINDLADQIDYAYEQLFTVKTMNLIADDILRRTLPNSDRIAYLENLQEATNNYMSSVPSADYIYISTLERLLNILHRQNNKFGLIRIGIDYRNINGIDNALLQDFEHRPYNVTIRIVDGPYKTRIMNAINSFAEGRDFSVLKLKVNKYIICHIKVGGIDGTVKIGTVNPDYTFSSSYSRTNPEIVIDSYLEGYDPTGNGRVIAGVQFAPIAKLKFDAINGQGVPATTTYSQLLSAAYQNVWVNSSIYKKFKP